LKSLNKRFRQRHNDYVDREKDKKGSRKDFKIQGPDNRNTTHVEGKNKGDTSNKRNDWDRFKIIHKIHKQHTRKP